MNSRRHVLLALTGSALFSSHAPAQENSGRIILFRNYYYGQSRDEILALPGARPNLGDDVVLESNAAGRACDLLFEFARNRLVLVSVCFDDPAAYPEAKRDLVEREFAAVSLRSESDEFDIFAPNSSNTLASTIEQAGIARRNLFVIAFPREAVQDLLRRNVPNFRTARQMIDGRHRVGAIEINTEAVIFGFTAALAGRDAQNLPR